MAEEAAKIETGFAGRQPGLWAAAFALAIAAAHIANWRLSHGPPRA